MKKKCTVRFYSNLKGQMLPANTVVQDPLGDMGMRKGAFKNIISIS